MSTIVYASGEGPPSKPVRPGPDPEAPKPEPKPEPKNDDVLVAQITLGPPSKPVLPPKPDPNAPQPSKPTTGATNILWLASAVDPAAQFADGPPSKPLVPPRPDPKTPKPKPETSEADLLTLALAALAIYWKTRSADFTAGLKTVSLETMDGREQTCAAISVF